MPEEIFGMAFLFAVLVGMAGDAVKPVQYGCREERLFPADASV